jgi:hypothetical protein
MGWDWGEDLVTFGGATRRKHRQEREQQAAQAAGTQQQQMEGGYADYRKNIADTAGAYEGTMRDIDLRSKEGLDQYQTNREVQNQRADQTREGLFNQLQYNTNQGIENVQNLANDYTKDLENLSNQAQTAASDARQTYTGTIQPEMRSALERSRQYEDEVANSAMSLQQSMDPNNDVATGQRKLYGSLAEKMADQYNQQGQELRQEYLGEADRMAGLYDEEQAAAQQRIEDQMAAERADLEGLMGRGVGTFEGLVDQTQKRGQADFGVLSALGSQAAGQMMGAAGAPLTGSQAAAIMATQGQQASEAYAAAQRRMQALEDQKRSYQLSQLTAMGDKAADLRRMGVGTADQIGASKLGAQLGLTQAGLGVQSQMAGRGLDVGAGLQERGLEAGRAESAAAYERGARERDTAMERTARRVADMMGAETSYQGMQSGLRGEQAGYGRDIYGARGDAESTRQAGVDRLFGARRDIEEGKISRQRGDLTEDHQILMQKLGIDAAAADRILRSSRETAAMDYEQGREMAGLQRSGVLENLMMQQANEQASFQETMGLLGLGVDIYSGTKSGAEKGK